MILCFFVFFSSFAQDNKAKEIIEKYKTTIGKERWTKTIIYKQILPTTSRSIDASILFNGVLGNATFSIEEDSTLHFRRKRSKFEHACWELILKQKDTIQSHVFLSGGSPSFLIPDVLIANDTTTWYYKGEDTKEKQKVYAVATYVDNLVYTLFFNRENYYLVAYTSDVQKKNSSVVIDDKPRNLSLKKNVLNQSTYGFFSDYRKVGNLLFPFKVVETIGTNKPHTTIFKEIKVSQDSLKEIFYIPQHLIDLRKAKYSSKE
ncbi:MAG: hypothetical protein MUC49_19585 [Raineya sp.]|nr:hypothetical protein [Raineya sp.]